MCTAVVYRPGECYFGRTLDHDCSYGEEVTVTPRRFPFAFSEAGRLEEHYAMIGMACVLDGYPLYYDCVNEKGLCIAGLNFSGNACYRKSVPGKDNLAQYELIPWLLGQCATLEQARQLLQRLNVTDRGFREDLPPAQLHWLIADRDGALTVEAVQQGLRISENPVGVLTNSPPFEMQLEGLNRYMNLSAQPAQNRFCPQLPLHATSRGMGAVGLPGDLSSHGRFVRAAFMKCNSVCDGSEAGSVGQLFHILDTVQQPRGCCDLGMGNYELTQYTACCNADRGIYYYTTYGNRQITAVELHREPLDGAALCRYRLADAEQIRRQN